MSFTKRFIQTKPTLAADAHPEQVVGGRATFGLAGVLNDKERAMTRPAAAEQAHTPTPWVSRAQTNKDGDCLGWIIETEKGSRIAWPAYADKATNLGEGRPFSVTEANAAFIVRACNAHAQLAADRDALVAALRDLINDIDIQVHGGNAHQYQVHIRQARAALAAVGSRR
jgi:hypothetical protein